MFSTQNEKIVTLSFLDLNLLTLPPVASSGGRVSEQPRILLTHVLSALVFEQKDRSTAKSRRGTTGCRRVSGGWAPVWFRRHSNPKATPSSGAANLGCCFLIDAVALHWPPQVANWRLLATERLVCRARSQSRGNQVHPMPRDGCNS